MHGTHFRSSFLDQKLEQDWRPLGDGLGNDKKRSRPQIHRLRALLLISKSAFQNRAALHDGEPGLKTSFVLNWNLIPKMPRLF